MELTTLAQAEHEAAGKQAEAKRLLADALRAEQAAPGLAEAQVREASALAIEKVGIAEARVIEAKAEASLKQGSNEARVLAETCRRRRRVRKDGLARATATESLGNAEAGVVQKKLLAEAEGLVRKFEAIASLSDGTWP